MQRSSLTVGPYSAFSWSFLPVYAMHLLATVWLPHWGASPWITLCLALHFNFTSNLTTLWLFAAGAALLCAGSAIVYMFGSEYVIGTVLWCGLSLLDRLFLAGLARANPWLIATGINLWLLFETAHFLHHAKGLPVWMPVSVVVSLYAVYRAAKTRLVVPAMVSLGDVILVAYHALKRASQAYFYDADGALDMVAHPLWPLDSNVGAVDLLPAYREWRTDPWALWLTERSDLAQTHAHVAVLIAGFMTHWSIAIVYAALYLVRLVRHHRSRSAYNVPTDYSHLVTGFRALEMPLASKLGAGHSHRNAGAARNDAVVAIDTYIHRHGGEPYAMQMANRDISAKQIGALVHIIPLDTHHAEKVDPLTERSFLKLINVDYYMDPMWYLWVYKPILIYTFTPSSPGGSEHGEVTWCTNLDNTITMNVSGGSSYRHELWEWSRTSVTAQYGHVQMVYTVEPYSVTDNWTIFLLAPRTRGVTLRPGWGCDVARKKLVVESATFATITAARALKKVPAKQPCCVVRNIRLGHTLMHVSMPGVPWSVSISNELHLALQARARLDPDVGTASAASWAASLVDGASKQSALYGPVLIACYPIDYLPTTVPGTAPKNAEERGYGNAGDPPTEGKPMAIKLCPSILGDTAWIPEMSKAADAETVTKRLTDLRNSKTLPAKFMTWTVEFIELLVPTFHKEVPVDIDDVIAARTRPAQRAADVAALEILGGPTDLEQGEVKAFIKKEFSADGSKPPRPISNLPNGHCILYSQFTKVVANFLKATPWYAFGLHPRDVDARVAKVARESEFLVETDYSRFDGTHSHALYMAELSLMRRIFDPRYHAQLTRVFTTMLWMRARTTEGIYYETDGSRLSGAADTSVGNTFDNALVAFCALRSKGFTKAEAWDKLGVYGGDDGLSADIDPAHYDSIAADFGLRLKATRKDRGEQVGFLGRNYLDPWHSEGESIVDVQRQFRKFHMFPGRDTIVAGRPMVGLIGKALGFLALDADTPGVAELSRTVLRLATREDKRVYETRRVATGRSTDNYSAHDIAKVMADQYVAGTFVIPPIDDHRYNQRMDAVVNNLGVSAENLVQWCGKVVAMTAMDQLPALDNLEILLPPGRRRGEEFTPPLRGEELKPTAPPPPLPPAPMVCGVPFTRLQYVRRSAAISTMLDSAPARERALRQIMERAEIKNVDFGQITHIYDVTAHVGVSAIMLRHVLGRSMPITAVESDPEAHIALMHNLYLPAVGAAHPPSEIFCARSLPKETKFTASDVVIFDPTWGEEYNRQPPLKMVKYWRKFAHVLYISDAKLGNPEGATFSAGAGPCIFSWFLPENRKQAERPPMAPIVSRQMCRRCKGSRDHCACDAKRAAPPNPRPRVPLAIPIRKPPSGAARGSDAGAIVLRPQRPAWRIPPPTAPGVAPPGPILIE